MEERQWERIGAGAGIVFVVLLVVSAFMVPQPPHIDASTAKITTYITDHRSAILVSQVVGTFAALAFIWFVGHLRHVLDRAEGGAEAFSAIVVVAGATLAAAGMLVGFPMTVLAFMAKGPGGLVDGPTVRLLFDSSQILGGIATMLFAPFLLAMGYAMVRKELVAAWLGWLSMAVAILDLVAGIGLMTQATYSSAWNILGFAGFLAAGLVILIASVSMVWHPEAERAVSHTPVFAH
jgi:hypothetical protein